MGLGIHLKERGEKKRGGRGKKGGKNRRETFFSMTVYQKHKQFIIHSVSNIILLPLSQPPYMYFSSETKSEAEISKTYALSLSGNTNIRTKQCFVVKGGYQAAGC